MSACSQLIATSLGGHLFFSIIRSLPDAALIGAFNRKWVSDDLENPYSMTSVLFLNLLVTPVSVAALLAVFTMGALFGGRHAYPGSASFRDFVSNRVDLLVDDVFNRVPKNCLGVWCFFPLLAFAQAPAALFLPYLQSGYDNRTEVEPSRALRTQTPAEPLPTYEFLPTFLGFTPTLAAVFVLATATVLYHDINTRIRNWRAVAQVQPAVVFGSQQAAQVINVLPAAPVQPPA